MNAGPSLNAEQNLNAGQSLNAGWSLNAGLISNALSDVERSVQASGYLVLVPNPPHHPHGDFGLTPGGWLWSQEDRA